jgi:hypothetical protein
MLQTPFWRNAANALPPHGRERHATYLEAAERWDVALDEVIEACTRVAAVIKRFQGFIRNPARPNRSR